MPTWLIVVLSILGYFGLALLTIRIALTIAYGEFKRLTDDDWGLSVLMGIFWPVTWVAFGAMQIGIHLLKPAVKPAALRRVQKKEQEQKAAEEDKQNALARAGELGLPFPVTRYDPTSDLWR